MAEAVTEQQQIDAGQGEVQRDLKYLDFVHLAAIHSVLCFSRLYVYAKENSGPLKPRVEAVEVTVKTVVRPVYEKFHGVPYDLLKSADRKVDESVTELERRLPPSLKKASAQAYATAQRAPEVARSVAGEVQRAGVASATAGFAKAAAASLEPAARQLFARCEPAAEHCAVVAWRAANRLPLFPQVAQMAAPAAAHWSEKYNSAVSRAAERGYAAAAYLPLVPAERIAVALASAGGDARE